MAKRGVPEISDEDIEDFDVEDLSDVDLDTAQQAARDTAVMLSARAVRELSEILHNSKNSTQARVAAGNGVLRAAGLFNRGKDDLSNKEPHEMSPEELSRNIYALERLAAERAKAAAKPDIFS